MALHVFAFGPDLVLSVRVQSPDGFGVTPQDYPVSEVIFYAANRHAFRTVGARPFYPRR